MAYYTSSYSDQNKKDPFATGQNAYQTSTPAPMYQPVETPKAATTSMYGDGFTSSDPNVQAQIKAMQQQAINSASPGAKLAETLRTSGIVSAEQAEQIKSPGSPILAAFSGSSAPVSTQQPIQSYVPSVPTQQTQGFTTPTVQALMAQKGADGGFSGLSQEQARLLFGSDMTGVQQSPDGTYSISGLSLADRKTALDPFTPTVAYLDNGQFTLTRPNAWTTSDELLYQGDLRELQQLENAINQPGAGAAFIAQTQNRLNDLRQKVNQASQRKQLYSATGVQDTSNLTDQEYAESIVADPNASQASLNAAYEALGLLGKQQKEKARQASEAGWKAYESQSRIKYQNDRDRLLGQLALRGLSPESDSEADKELRDLDDKYAALDNAERAKIAANEVATDEKTRAYLTSLADRRIKEAHDQIADQVNLANARANAYAKLSTADTNAAKVDVQEEKNRITQAYNEGKLSNEQYKNEIARLNAESLSGLREAQSGLAEANTEYVAGAKTENTQANTGYTIARTATEDALRDAQLAKLQAEVVKVRAQASKAASGGKSSALSNVTNEELLGAQQMFQGQGGTGVLSGKKLEDAVSIYRAAQTLKDESVSGTPSLKGAVESKKTYNVTTKPPSGELDANKILAEALSAASK